MSLRKWNRLLDHVEQELLQDCYLTRRSDDPSPRRHHAAGGKCRRD